MSESTAAITIDMAEIAVSAIADQMSGLINELQDMGPHDSLSVHHVATRLAELAQKHYEFDRLWNALKINNDLLANARDDNVTPPDAAVVRRILEENGIPVHSLDASVDAS